MTLHSLKRSRSRSPVLQRISSSPKRLKRYDYSRYGHRESISRFSESSCGFPNNDDDNETISTEVSTSTYNTSSNYSPSRIQTYSHSCYPYKRNFPLSYHSRSSNETLPSNYPSTHFIGSNHSISRRRTFEPLPLEFWERSEECKEAKFNHLDRLDAIWGDREQLVLLTTLAESDIVLERNMFPYDTPKGIEHYTLWSIHDLYHHEIVDFVDHWLMKYFPQVRRWEYDDNSGDRSINLFHVHVFIETIPYSFQPNENNNIYYPLHAAYKMNNC